MTNNEQVTHTSLSLNRHLSSHGQEKNWLLYLIESLAHGVNIDSWRHIGPFLSYKGGIYSKIYEATIIDNEVYPIVVSISQKLKERFMEMIENEY